MSLNPTLVAILMMNMSIVTASNGQWVTKRECSGVSELVYRGEWVCLELVNGLTGRLIGSELALEKFHQ